jgi:hypothetical protein
MLFFAEMDDVGAARCTPTQPPDDVKILLAEPVKETFGEKNAILSILVIGRRSNSTKLSGPRHQSTIQETPDECF